MTDDASLADALAAGDGEAARELYRRHCHAILRFAVAMTNNRATAEDIVHDTFVELLHRPRNYDPGRGSVRAFLYGIARHRIAKSTRRAAPVPADLDDHDAHSHRAVASEPPELAAADLAGTPEDQIERAQEIKFLRAAIRALPLVYREVIAWCDLEDVPYATVADILHCPVGTVRSRLHRARALLAETYQSLRNQCENPRGPDRATADSAAQPCTPLTAALKSGST